MANSVLIRLDAVEDREALEVWRRYLAGLGTTPTAMLRQAIRDGAREARERAGKERAR